MSFIIIISSPQLTFTWPYCEAVMLTPCEHEAMTPSRGIRYDRVKGFMPGMHTVDINNSPNVDLMSDHVEDSEEWGGSPEQVAVVAPPPRKCRHCCAEVLAWLCVYSIAGLVWNAGICNMPGLECWHL
eukprot:g4373.t1